MEVQNLQGTTLWLLHHTSRHGVAAVPMTVPGYLVWNVSTTSILAKNEIRLWHWKGSETIVMDRECVEASQVAGGEEGRER